MQKTYLRNNIAIRRNNSKWPIIFAACGLIIIYFVFFQGEHGLIQYWRLLSEKKQLQEKIIELRNEQEQLKNEIKLLESDYAYIEKIARERYKMGRAGEKIYVIKKQ